jgi:hypothetical protein
MTTHAEHHFVPKFLLQAWEGGADGKLSAFRWVRGQVLERRFKARSVAKGRNLYAIQRNSPGSEANQSLERDVMARQIDDPAARVYQQLAAGGLRFLTTAQRHAWTVFLTSLVLRGPGAIQLLRDTGTTNLNELLDEDPNAMLEIRGPEPEASLREFVEKHDPGLFDDFGLMSLPHLLQASMFNQRFYETRWVLRRLNASSQKLLIVDRPLTLVGSVCDKFLVYLPLAPDLAFLAFNHERLAGGLQLATDTAFVEAMNKASVTQASEYVFGVNDEHRALIERRLEKEPAGPGLALGGRPPVLGQAQMRHDHSGGDATAPAHA